MYKNNFIRFSCFQSILLSLRFQKSLAWRCQKTLTGSSLTSYRGFPLIISQNYLFSIYILFSYIFFIVSCLFFLDHFVFLFLVISRWVRASAPINIDLWVPFASETERGRGRGRSLFKDVLSSETHTRAKQKCILLPSDTEASAECAETYSRDSNTSIYIALDTVLAYFIPSA